MIAGILVSITILILMAPPPVSFSLTLQPAAELSIGTPVLVTFDSWRFLNATIHQNWAGHLDLVLFAVWKNSLGQTAAVNTGGIGMTGGESTNCYVPILGVPPGGYTVFLFVISTNSNPLSLVVNVPIYISGE